jgi:uncharacterized membrane protein
MSLGAPPGVSASGALDISTDGSVIAGNALVAEGQRAYRWTPPQGMTIIAAPPGVSECNAVAISGDGSVIVGWAHTGSQVAFRWTASTGVQLLAGTTVAQAVSADGRVIVGSAGATSFVWTAARGPTPVESLLAPVLPGGWSIQDHLYAVSADGLRIAGWGYNPSGRAEAWRATLSPEVLFCYANCDLSTGSSVLNVNDFICFQSRFAAADPYADCNRDSALNLNDFVCFQAAFAAGCP